MASLIIERARQADNRTINLLHGYSKHLQTLISRNKTDHVVPKLVVCAMIAFYYNPEYFTVHGGNIILNDARTVATNTKNDRCFTLNTVYGSIKITEYDNYNKFVWEFKISKASPNLIIGIGLDSSDKLYTHTAFDFHLDSSHVFYSFEDDGDSANINSYTEHAATPIMDLDYNCKEYGTRFTLGHENTVIMELDTKHETLRYYVNGQDQGIAVDKDLMQIDSKEFVAAISMNDEVTVELLRFDKRQE